VRKRITAKDLTFGERAAATAVWAAMKANTKIGMGLERKRKNRQKNKYHQWQNAVIPYLFYRC